MGTKYDYSSTSKLDEKQVSKMVESLERQAKWLTHLVNFVEAVIPNDSDPVLLRIRDEFFKKDFLIAAGTMNTVAKAIRSKKI